MPKPKNHPLSEEQWQRINSAYFDHQKCRFESDPSKLTANQSYCKHFGDAHNFAVQKKISVTALVSKETDTEIATQLHHERRPREHVVEALRDRSPKAAEFMKPEQRLSYAKEVEDEAFRKYDQEQNQHPERSRQNERIDHRQPSTAQPHQPKALDQLGPRMTEQERQWIMQQSLDRER